MKKIHFPAILALALLTACAPQKNESTDSSKTTESKPAHEELTDLPTAVAKAKAENKLVFLNFSGSDWCPPCQMMAREVFPTKEFQDYSRTNLIFVEIDFPRTKPQAEALKKANEDLAERFKIEVFPTMVVLGTDEKTIWRSEGALETAKEVITGIESAKKP